MNNLKRVLSLGLVGAMLSGMMIMGAGAAAYTDVDDIEHIEAVNTMGSLNIINGKDDGSFSPEESVTRSQMAKMIAVAMNGGKEPNFGVKTSPTFTDIKGHWAETFIEYCNDNGIISGRGDGTFDPDSTVTGVEAAKMVLVALGYDAGAYQLTGAAWDTNVNREATQSCKPSLYDTLEDVAMHQAITRDVAAQMIWNGLQNETMSKTPDKTISTGEVTYNYRPSGETFLEVHYDATIVYGTLTGNDKTTSGLLKGEIEVSNVTGYGTTTSGTPIVQPTATFPWDTDLTDIGEKVKVIFKDNNTNGTRGRLDKQDKIYGVFNTHETEVVTGTSADVKKVDGASNNGKQVLKIAGVEHEVATDGVTLYTNYVLTGGVQNFNAARVTVAGGVESDLSKALRAANGNSFKAVKNTDGKIKTIYLTEYDIGVVTAVSSDKVTINTKGVLKKADNDIYEGVAKDDVVVVTTLYHTTASNDNAYNIVKKAEVVAGELTRFKDLENVTVDGTVYKLWKSNYASTDTATHELFNTDISKALTSAVSGNEIGKEVELYMVEGFVAAIKVVSKDATNYSVVMEVNGKDRGDTNGAAEKFVNSTFNDVKIQVMGVDGEKVKLTVSDDSYDEVGNKDVTSSTYFQEGDIIVYDMNKDGTATVTVKKHVTKDPATYDKDTKSVNGKVTTAECVLFVKDLSTSKWKVYNIRNLGDVTATASAILLDDGKVVAASMNTHSGVHGAGSNRVYGIVSAFNGTVKIDGTKYRQYVISVNGEEYTVNWRENDAMTGGTAKIAKGNIVTFEPTSDNFYEESDSFIKLTAASGTVAIRSDALTAEAVYVKEYVAADGIITFHENVTPTPAHGSTTYPGNGTTYTYAVDDDVKMYYVDTDNDVAAEGGSVLTLNTMTGKKTAILVYETDTYGNKNVVAIIAEQSGSKGVNE